MPFQMTLSPGVMNGLSQPILISFTSPEVADRVSVTLFEADRWGTGAGQVTESTPDDRIVVVSGRPIGQAGATNTLVVHRIA